MIINPQINNLRIVIFVLTALVISLAGYSVYTYKTLNDYNNFLVNENTAIEIELNHLIQNYNTLEVDNKEINTRLDESRIRISRILDSVTHLKPEIVLVTNYKKEHEKLKQENKRILELVDQLHAENKFLKEEALMVETELIQSKNQNENLKYKNSTLSIINKNLQSKVEQAKQLIVSGVTVEAVKKITSKGDVKTTTSARRTKMLNVCFAIAENNIAPEEKSNFYIQIVDPNNNVLGEKIEEKVGEESIIFSKKINVDYNGQQVNACLDIKPPSNQKFTKGSYFVSVYNKNNLVANTTFSLD